MKKTKEEIQRLAQISWETENRNHPDSINPTPYILGFRVGYGSAIDKSTPLESFEILVQAIQFINKMKKYGCL